MNLCAARRKFLLLGILAPLLPCAAEPRAIDLSVVRRKAEGGVRTVRISKDESVALRVRADEPMTIHVHGYDVEVRAEPGSVARVSFTAGIVGRFPVSAHLPVSQGDGKAAEPTLLYLEVHPR
jgi:hypothetical protein